MGRRLYRNKHHLTPKSRGGTKTPSNLLLLWNDTHLEWHRVFGNRTLREVIVLLQRVERMKRRVA